MATILDLGTDTTNLDIFAYNTGDGQFLRTAQSFSFSDIPTITGAEGNIKCTGAGTGPEITVRIETDNANKPSGTLAHANLTATIAGFADQTFAWKTVTFTTTTLSSGIKYWLVFKATTESGTPTPAYWIAGASSALAGHAYSEYNVGGSGAWSTVAAQDAAIRISGSLLGAVKDYAFFL